MRQSSTRIEVEGQDVMVSDAVLGRAAAKLLEGYTPDHEQHYCCRVALSLHRACWHQAAAVLTRYWIAHRDELPSRTVWHSSSTVEAVEHEPADVLW